MGLITNLRASHLPMDVRLLLGGTLTLCLAALLAAVGRAVQARKAEGLAGRALLAYAIWWWSGAALLAIYAAHSLLGGIGVTSLDLFLALQQASYVAIALALGSLMHYLLFLLTGRSVVAPLVAVYGGYFVVESYAHASRGPWTLVSSGFEMHPTPLPGASSATPPAIMLVLVGPLLLGLATCAYAAVRGPRGEPRDRAVLLLAAFAGWALGVGVTFVEPWQREPWYALAYLLPGLASGLVALAAYHPPLRGLLWRAVSRAGENP